MRFFGVFVKLQEKQKLSEKRNSRTRKHYTICFQCDFKKYNMKTNTRNLIGKNSKLQNLKRVF